MIEKIRNLMKEIGCAMLSNTCGKYYSIVMNEGDSDCCVLSFEGRYGYGSTSLGRLRTQTVEKIYNDLKIDFDL